MLAVVAGAVAVGAQKSHALITTPAELERIADYERIGELTSHTTRAIVVDGRLAHPIMYWGWIVGRGVGARLQRRSFRPGSTRRRRTS